MTLKLTDWVETGTCPRCKGRGREIAGKHLSVRTLNKGMPSDTPGDKSWIPCRECNGRKTVGSAKK